MKTYKSNINTNENGLNIYTIFFRASYMYDNLIHNIVYESSDASAEHMNKIAKLGGTKKTEDESTYQGLDDAFQKIADAINPKFGLKIYN